MKKLVILAILLQAGCLINGRLPDDPPEVNPTPVLSEPKAGHRALLLPSGRVLITGGVNASGVVGTIEEFDPNTRVSTVVATGSPRFNHTMTLLSNGDVLLVGGLKNTSGAASNSVEVVNPSTFAVLSLTMPVARTNHTATKLKDGRVLITGGENTGALSSTCVYDNGLVTAGPNMGFSRSSHSANRLPNGNVLFVGGFGSGMGNAEIYNTAANNFSTPIGVWTPRFLHKASVTDGGILITGGFNGTTSLFHPEFFSFHSQAFTFLANDLPVRDAHGATTLADGRVFLSGGASTGVVTDVTAIYDPEEIRIRPSYNLSFKRADHTATLLASGEVLLTGGVHHAGSGIFFDDIEILSIP